MNATLLETFSKHSSTYLAGRVSRRSFMGRLGRGAIAATLGGAGATLLLNQRAEAHTCPCSNCGNSIGCGTLTGVQGSCPSDTCQCGCWCINVSSDKCASGIREWCDCCGGCAEGSGGCRCVNGIPTCCYHKEWPEGCGSADTHIKCRYHKCVSSSQCERFS